MALPDPLALKSAAAAAKAFTRRRVLPNGAVYTSTDSTNTVTDSVIVTSQNRPKKGTSDAAMVNLVRFTRTKIDTDGLPHKMEASFQLTRALDPDIQDADMTEVYAWFNEFLIASAGDYKARFNRGET